MIENYIITKIEGAMKAQRVCNYQMCVYVCVRYHQKMFATKVRMQNLLEGLAVSEVEVNCKNGGNCREKCCYGPGLNLNTFHIDYSNSLATGPLVSTYAPCHQILTQ